MYPLAPFISYSQDEAVASPLEMPAINLGYKNMSYADTMMFPP